MAVVLALAIVSYPIAYRRRMRYVVEGSGVFNTRNFALLPIRRLLHVTLLRNAVQRGIYHFISCSLLRTQRHRVYMAMYGGLGLALLISCAVLLKPSHARLGFALSTDGLRAAVPIAAFWTIAGLRNAFLSPADRRGGWIFRVILGKARNRATCHDHALDTAIRIGYDAGDGRADHSCGASRVAWLEAHYQPGAVGQWPVPAADRCSVPQG